MDIFKGIDSIYRINTSRQTPKCKRQWLRRMARKLEDRASAFSRSGQFHEADDLNSEAASYYATADELQGNF